MSTKNLARTAIEGGRYGSNKFQRRKSRKVERATVKQAVNRTVALIDQDGEVRVRNTKSIGPVRPEFKDRLNSMYRFLDRNVGRPWRLVYSEIRDRYDARTTPGRHILFDHLLRSIEGSGQQEGRPGGFRWHDYYIDRVGLLKKHPKKSRRKPTVRHPPLPSIARWLNGHGVVLNGGTLYWGVATDGEKYCVEVIKRDYGNWPIGLRYRRLGRDGKPAMTRRYIQRYLQDGKLVTQLIEEPDYQHPRFRQQLRMSKPDIEFFERLPLSIKQWLGVEPAGAI